MNLTSIVSLPSPLFLTIYYWLFQISFYLSLLIAPFLFYIILTQSNSLKSYKWFILNHSIWSLAFQICYGLLSPILLLPAAAILPLSFIRNNETSYPTSLITIIGIHFAVYYHCSLTVTIGSRYMTIFPSKYTKWITRKSLILSQILWFFIVSPWGFIAANSMLSKDSNTTLIEAISFDDFFETIQEPSLSFVSLKDTQILLSLALFIEILFFFLGIAVIFVFKHLVQKYSTVSVTKLQRSMIISSVVQILLTLFLINLPVTTLIIFILFRIPHTSNFACICTLLISIHTFLEFSATLYFVSPYRKFIQKKFQKAYKVHVSKIVTVVESTEMIKIN